MFMSAVATLHTQEAVFEQPTIQEVFELLANKLGKVATSGLGLLIDVRLVLSDHGQFRTRSSL